MHIYCATNLVSGKKYVGLTTKSVEDRWSTHVADAKNSNTVIAKAIRKYGAASFEVVAIDIAETEEQLSHKERFWIRELNSLAPNGYNLKEGGFYGLATDALKKRLSRAALRRFQRDGEREAQSARITAYFEQEGSSEKQSAAIRKYFCDHQEAAREVGEWSKTQWVERREYIIAQQRSGWEAPMSRQNASAAAKARHASGAYDRKKKKVKSEDGRKFSSIVEAAAHYGVAPSHVRRCINENRPMKNGVCVSRGE